MNVNLIVGVAVEKVSYTADILYKYQVPREFESYILVGKRVIVPFGRGNSVRQGIILEVNDIQQDSLKSINMVLDIVSPVSKEMIMIIKWVKEKYFCTYFEAAKLVIPSGINGNISKIKYKILNPLSECEKFLSDDEKKLMSKISQIGDKYITLKEIRNLKIPNYSGLLMSLISKNIIEEKFDAFKTVGERNLNIFNLSEKIDYEKLNLRENQKKICEYLKSHKNATSKEICYFTGVSVSSLNTLIKKNIIIKSTCKKYISPGENCETRSEKTIKNFLNEEQKIVFESLLKSYKHNKFKNSLLYGVTGSGKTEVILNLMDYVVEMGRSVIYMLPEILLTSQFVDMFRSRYEDKVAVIHSGISEWERFDAWKKISSGEIRVVLGTRSAVFAPVKNLGLIVVDEEHEFTYKSENSPRFNAKEVAKYRCKKSGGMVLFSSATPSFETYCKAKNGVYDLYTLKNRYGICNLPKVEIIDMNKEFKSLEVNQISGELLKSLKDNLEHGNQSIIFINRRGYNTFAKCMECGEVLMCPNCSVSLNYHKANGRLMCHYCDFSEKISDRCPSCGGKICYSGLGTQKIEDILTKIFPKARILRMDSDSKTYNLVGFKKFSEGKYDILIGTQMISKGFNFPGVTLVGVISADSMLYGSDFRSFERAFSIFTQVIGRAGRKKIPGKAIIQSFSPENEVLKFAARQDYEGFFESEIKMRKLMLYPPYSDICVIGFSDKKEEKVISASREFFKILKNIASKKYSVLPLRILPPNPEIIKKVSSKFRYKIIIKCKNTSEFRCMISEVYKEFFNISLFKNVNVFVDINPERIL